tara:strand:- start:88 stop:537 length:450 start_codon:yes stop_codon:yes gene_type:complete
VSNTIKYQKKLQKEIDKYNRYILLNKERIDKSQSQIDGWENNCQNHSDIIQLYKDIINIKPTILLNSGRDKKYVYGKVWWYSNLFEEGLKSKKKEFRYFLGKMDKKKPKYYWEDILLSKFYEKHKVSFDGIPTISILNWEYDEDGKLLK